MRKLRFRRKAVSNIIGGIIILSLFLIALTAMVVLNQQYDAYQGAVVKMTREDIDRSSENLVAIYPGLNGSFPVSCGVSCSLNQYNMSLANLGGVGVQIARIYINSTTQPTQPTQTGCATSAKGPCVLNPVPITSKTSMSFAQDDSYISAGEFSHFVRIWLPGGSGGIMLPNVALTPSNGISIVTTRGRVFSFTWPFPPAGQGTAGSGSPVNIETGTMKIAYNGTYNSHPDACHQEAATPLPSNVQGTKSLYFVNPWTNSTVLTLAHIYVYAYSADTLNIPITFSWGQLVIMTATSGSNQKQYFVGGDYVGIVWKNKFWGAGTAVTVQPGDDFYFIFQITNINYGAPTSSSGDLFTGTATVNNAYGTTNEGPLYRAFVIYLDGLYVRANGGRC
ncbi:MAG: hypothetical protein ABSC50_01820 [Candidatus Bathyarchaeia archaeon]